MGCVDVGFGVGVFVTMGNLLPEDFPSEADSPSKGSRVQSRARGKGICWVCVCGVWVWVCGWWVVWCVEEFAV